MALQEAVVQVTHVKGNIFGETGSGKTVTAALLALYLSKTYHNSAPVAMWSSEPGVDYIIEFFKIEGVQLLVERDKSFNAMVEAGLEAEKRGCCCFLPDSVTHAWRDLVDSYCKKRRIQKPEFQHWSEIKGPENWGQFADWFINSQMNVLTCGRAGYEYDHELDEEGKQQLVKGDSKMKAEGEFGYEADLLVEMTHSTDKVEKRREMIRKRSTRNRAQADDGKKPIGMHFALIKKSRIWSLNDQLFSFKNQSGYTPGYYIEVGKPFAPYFDWLAGNRKGLVGAATAGRPVVNSSANSQSRFTDTQFDSKSYKRKGLFEEFTNIMAELFNTRTSKGSHANLLVGRLITGSASALQFRAKATEDVEHCVELLKKFAQNFKEGKASVDTATDEDLTMLVDLSREEINFEAHMNDTPEPSADAKASVEAMQDTESAVF